MLELRRNSWPAGLAFPTPEKLEALAVPTNESSRGHDGQSAVPIEPAAQPQQVQSRWIGDPAGRDSALLVERDLFAQEQVLGGKQGSGS